MTHSRVVRSCAHARNKRVILCRKRDAKLHFDLAQERTGVREQHRTQRIPWQTA